MKRLINSEEKVIRFSVVNLTIPCQSGFKDRVLEKGFLTEGLVGSNLLSLGCKLTCLPLFIFFIFFKNARLASYLAQYFFFIKTERQIKQPNWLTE